ncbi:uncharacterized protein LOC127712031 isoform X2 [Mytilus californianus]|uniref:uncharacterized protein LOC127712031 isoform X2 n=1 Tax=Mytilus californianus TaxID=6549 RepID=UPI0022479763|nr:uncharacterized protein LOC127712031 isoform X2 [Mytilus californianus]
MATYRLTRRLNRELLDISTNPPPGISAGPINDDMLNWQGIISGPVNFTTKIYHLNIYVTGSICEYHMGLQWSPAVTISKILLNISALLTSPNLDCRLNGEAANLYELDRIKYNETAAEWTRKYAM